MTQNQNTEIVKTENPMLSTLKQEEYNTLLASELSDNISSITTMRPTVIKILHAGALMFSIPSCISDKPRRIEEFSGVIIFAHKTNACWLKEFSESGGEEAPFCVSNDGQTGVQQKGDGQTFNVACSKCEYNKFGSAKGRAKKCKNMIRLFILLDGDSFPSVLFVPPSSIVTWDKYAYDVTTINLPYTFIRTKFSLQNDTNKDGISFSKLKLSKLETLSSEEIIKIQKIKNEIKSKLSELSVTETDLIENYAKNTTTDTTPF